jgi:hypothetical protein
MSGTAAFISGAAAASFGSGSIAIAVPIAVTTAAAMIPRDIVFIR